MQIKFNGRPLDTDATDLWQLKLSQDFNHDDAVVIVNGYQTNEALPLKAQDEVVMLRKGQAPPPDLLAAMLAARHTPGVYAQVQQARVAVAGLGGLGSAIAIALARTGVGRLHLIDFDVVEPTNLNRQQYKLKHLGLPKPKALMAEIAEINPFVKVTATCERVTPANLARLFAADEIICEAFDDPAAKAMLVSNLLASFPAKKIVAASGMAGYGSANAVVTRRLGTNFYICGDGQTPAEPGRGLMAPRVGVCAHHQANMVLRLILGEDEV